MDGLRLLQCGDSCRCAQLLYPAAGERLATIQLPPLRRGEINSEVDPTTHNPSPVGVIHSEESGSGFNVLGLHLVRVSMFLD